MIKRCENCKGRGHVFDSKSLCGGPFIWAISLFEYNNPEGLSRETCAHCDGEGYIKINEKEQ